MIPGPYVAQILSSETGLLSYPTKKYPGNVYFAKKNWQATLKIFQLCLTLVKNVQNSVKTYIIEIIEVALPCFSLTDSSKVRDIILKLTSTILSAPSFKSKTEAIVLSLYKQFKRLYSTNPRLFKSDSVNRSFGILIGTFCKYPQKFDKHQLEIEELLVTNLKKSMREFIMNSSKRTTGYEPIPGYFEGLNCYLEGFFPKQLEPGVNRKPNRTIYNIIKEICNYRDQNSSTYKCKYKLLSKY